MKDEELPGDASTLIYLAKTSAFAEAGHCITAILVPPAVWREAVDDAERLDYPDVPQIRAAADSGFLARIELSDTEQALAGAIATQQRLGVGESEVLALGRRTGRALVDDGRAARVASSLGVVPISTLFLPVLGVRRGGLERQAAIALLRKLAIVTNARAETVYEIEAFIDMVT